MGKLLRPWLERTARDGFERISQYGSRPLAADYDALEPLSASQVKDYERQGFLSLPPATPASEVASIREELVALFDSHAGRDEGAELDTLSRDDGQLPPVQPEIIDPANYSSALREIPVRTWARRLATQLLGPEAFPNFEHAIKKPGGGQATPWHQDEAFRADGTVMYDQISIWIPLQDVSETNGCLQYVPGTHLGPVLEHQPVDGDPQIHALECIASQFDPRSAIACPIPAGAAVVHHGRTLHSACPNVSEEPRYAYVFVFRRLAAEGAERHDLPWQRERQTAALARKMKWLRRGGVVTEVRRRIRRH